MSTGERAHTPGFWVAKVEDPDRIDSNGWVVYDAEGYIVARKLTATNARLIAAAPETAAERDRLKAELKKTRALLAAAQSSIRELKAYKAASIDARHALATGKEG